MMPKQVNIVEVGPRDGLQNEAKTLSVETRVEFIKRLVHCGYRNIEVGALVSEAKVPQMANSDAVYQALPAHPGVHYPVLVPNRHGLETALSAGVKDIAVFAGASETFSQKNIHCSIDESLVRYEAVCQQALEAGMRVRGYVSCIAGCPYEGDVPTVQVLRVADALISMGCFEVSLGDTIGVGTPNRIQTLVETLAEKIPLSQIALHCHDTYGMALANIYAALERGISVFDSSVAGLGGCPYAKGASGNVATEDLLYLLHGLGIETGIDLEKVIDVGAFITKTLGTPSQSKVAKALRS